MASSSRTQSQLLQQSPINPRTGRVWTLVDPEVENRVSDLEKQIKDPAGAAAFLKKVGALTDKGHLKKKYGG